MKKIVCLLICFIMLFTVLPVSAASGSDLLGFASFEAKPSGAYVLTVRKGEYSEEMAHTGNVSIKAIGDPDYGMGYLSFRNLKVENQKTYNFSMWIYSTGGVTSIQPFIDYTFNGKVKQVAIDPSGTWPTCSNGKWVKYEVNFKINEAEGSSVTGPALRIALIGTEDAYIDDVELCAGHKDIAGHEWDDSAPEKIEIKGDTQEIYVDKDAAPNGDGSKEHPFNSLFAARDYVRTINKDMKKNIAVNIMGGFYEMTETFRLTEEDSGTNGYHVVWRAAEGEEVILSGGIKKTDWVESEIPGVYKTHNVGDTMRNLFVNDDIAKRARVDEYIVPLRWYNDPDDTTCDRDGVIIPKGIIKNPEAATNIELFKCVTFKTNWAIKGKAIESEEGTILSFRQPEFYWHQKAAYSFLAWEVTDDFRLENALEFLDEPGEWFQDIDTDTLYYMPKEGENIYESEIIAPVLENIIDVKGANVDNRAENIVISGLTMAYGGNDFTSEYGRQTQQSTNLHAYEKSHSYGAGFYTERGNLSFENARNILFKNNIVKNMGSVGVNMLQGIENCEIDGNAFFNTASAALTVGSSNHRARIDGEVLPRNITVSNNIITKAAFEYPTSSAVNIYYINGAYILNNVCYDTGYSGLSVGWGWLDTNLPQRRINIIGNRVWNTNTFGKDGSAIYTLGEAPESTLQYNYVSGVPGGDAMIIYHDQGSSYYYDYRNVINTLEPSSSTLNWVSTYRPEHKGIVLVENYTNHDKRSYVATETVETKTQFNPDASWSEGARYAISQSGLSEGYEYLYDLVPNWEEQLAIKNVTLQTKEQDNATPVQLKTGESVNLRALYERLNGELYFSEEFTSVWSTDESIVKCDGTKLTAVGSGVANVYATTLDGYELMISVTVNDEIKYVELYNTQAKFKVGDVTYLRYSVATKYWDYTHFPVEFVSSNPHVLTVNDMGELRAVRNGQSRITLRAKLDGKVCEEHIDVLVGSSATDATLSLDKYIYEVSEDSVLRASVVEGDSKTAISGGGVSALYEPVEQKSLDQGVLNKYSTAMKYMVSNKIIDDSWNATDKLTEEDFLVMLEKATGRSRDTMNVELKDGYITRERMAYLLIQAVKETWGNTMGGATRLTHLNDKDEVSPELVPYVASAIKYEFFYITGSVKDFNPKDYATIDQAANTIYRVLEPVLIRNMATHSHEFNKAYWTEQMMRNAHSVLRNNTNKTVVSSEISMGSGSNKLPEKTGDYKVNLSYMQNGQILEGTDYLFFYDKNNIMKSGEYTTAFVGENASGMFLEEDGKIRIIAETGNVWNAADSGAFAYKKIGENGDFEIVTTISGVANTDKDGGAGIMVRASNDASDIKIDYRIKPSGDTFLCWRGAKENITSYTQNAKLTFPATLKLVRRGNSYTAYYKDGDKWVQNGESPALSAIGGEVYAGLMFYTRSDRSGKPSATIFSDTYFGTLQGTGDEPVVNEEKPLETPKEEPVEGTEMKFTIDRSKYLDNFTNGSFERGINGWKVVNGSISKGNDAYNGKASLVYSPSGTGYITYSLGKINKNKTYYLVFKAKTQSGTATLSPYIQYHNGTTHVRGTMNFLTDMTATADEWKEFVVEVTFEGTVGAPLLVVNMSTSSNVYFDCMELLYK